MYPMNRSALRRWLAGLACLLGLAAAAPAVAAGSPWTVYDQGKVRLVSATNGVGGGRVLLGLHYQMAPGWEIYWRSPGEAGLPTTIDWQGSENLADATLRWPRPHRFQIFGLDTFGYTGEVVLPVEAQVPRPGEAARIRAQVNFLTCAEICVPHQVDLALDLPASGGMAPEAGLINRYTSLVPTPGPAAGLGVERAEIVQDGAVRLLQIVATSADPFRKPDVFVEGAAGYAFGRPDLRLTDGARRAVLQLPVSASRLANPDLLGTLVTVTLVDGDQAVEQTLTLRHGDGESTVFLSLGLALLLALLGGVILNVMPCVLPVLSIKLLAVLNAGQHDRRRVRRDFLATAAGIAAAFLALAAILVALRAGGAAVGWGLQFQSPTFIAVMAAVVVLFAANLWGLFTIPLPAWLGGAAAGGPKGGISGAFAHGVFATILATPCSAPFLGTAVAYALSRGAGETFAIFLALGLGMALPYLLVAALPRLVARLPRPGTWMAAVRRVLGLFLIGTGLWLLTVLFAQVGWPGAGLAAGLLVLAIAVLALLHRLAPMRAGLAVLAAAVFAVLTAASPTLTAPVTGQMAADEHWEPFDEAAIPRLVAEGRTVFVDVTADWCVTCKVNKSLVLQRGPVAALLADSRIVRMQADWTLPSPVIAGYLARHNRFGIPFNIVYGPQAPGGLALPELLSQDAVLDAIDRAAGGLRLAGR